MLSRCGRCSRRRGLLTAALAGGMIVFGLPAGTRASELPEDAAASDATGIDGGRTLQRLPVNLARGTVGVFSRDSLPPLLVGGGSAGIGYLLDDEVRDAIADPDDVWADFSDDNLGATGLGAAALGLYVGSRFSANERFRDVSYDLITATVVTLGYTAGLKVAAGRERPDESDDRSFPSGHTSNAFALASVAGAHYGSWVEIPSYLLASLIGVSRIRSDVHWFSDVLAGATLGHVVGRAAVRQNSPDAKDSISSESPVNLRLVLAPDFQGVHLVRHF